MPLSGMLTCGSCGTRTQMSTMRYNLTGSRLICHDCVQKERSSIKPGTTQPGAIKLQDDRIAGRAEASAALNQAGSQDYAKGTANYYCRSCHYKFSRRRDSEVGSCPYCGKQSVSHAYEGKAQDLIEEAGNDSEEEELF